MRNHSMDDGVFIRSSNKATSCEYLSKQALDAAIVLDALGKDVIFIETRALARARLLLRMLCILLLW